MFEIRRALLSIHHANLLTHSSLSLSTSFTLVNPDPDDDVGRPTVEFPPVIILLSLFFIGHFQLLKVQPELLHLVSQISSHDICFHICLMMELLNSNLPEQSSVTVFLEPLKPPLSLFIRHTPFILSFSHFTHQCSISLARIIHFFSLLKLFTTHVF